MNSQKSFEKVEEVRIEKLRWHSMETSVWQRARCCSIFSVRTDSISDPRLTVLQVLLAVQIERFFVGSKMFSPFEKHPSPLGLQTCTLVDTNEKDDDGVLTRDRDENVHQ